MARLELKIKNAMKKRKTIRGKTLSLLIPELILFNENMLNLPFIRRARMIGVAK